jgi:integrase
MNEIELNWFKISKYLGEPTKVVRDRSYTTEEIQHILTKCDERMRVVILLLASTGIRLGAGITVEYRLPDKNRKVRSLSNYSI